MTGIESYRGLEAWQEGMNLAQQCYYLTKEFPREELYGMVSQIRRSAASVPANIAFVGCGVLGVGCGFIKTNIVKLIASIDYYYFPHPTPHSPHPFLYIAQGSLKELETHLILSGRVGLASKEKIKKIIFQSEKVGKILGGLIRSIEKKNS